ncbi:hypothetical protein GC173_16935 [bacterium]|nr:hypothetical protein [bacterium]
MRRAVALFVEDRDNLILQSHCLHQSWRHIGAKDTDLVFMGPRTALERLPDDVVKVVQPAATDNPEWRGYVYVNSIACLAHPSASVLDDYDAVLRTDVDTFLTPAWNRFRPEGLFSGLGHYCNDDETSANLRRIAREQGLTHRGVTNIGSTLYGPPGLLRDICRLATELSLYIRTVEFKDHPGAWPGWYGAVATLYATEIAVNHLDSGFSVPGEHLLDYYSESADPVDDHPHIHCWHTDQLFSKFVFCDGGYRDVDEASLDLGVIREYCLAMALRARRRFPG